jgi:hypothetical protein
MQGDLTLMSLLLAALGVFAVALLLVALPRWFPTPPAKAPGGILAGTGLADGRLLLLADNALLLHGRSGRGLATAEAAQLGLATLLPPLAVDAAGRVLVGGRHAADDALRLWRCSLQPPACSAASVDALQAVAVSGDALGQLLFVLTPGGELLRIGPDGRIEARAALSPPSGGAALDSVDGLLLAPLPDAPLLGVYRSDRNGFGEQLDALLPLPSQAVDVTRIRNLALAPNAFWLLLETPDGLLLQRFDPLWKAVGPPFPVAASTQRLIAWGSDVLLAGAAPDALIRYSSTALEAQPFRPELLEARQQAWAQARRNAAWRRSASALLIVLGAAAVACGLLQWTAWHAFNRSPAAGSSALNPREPRLHWLPLQPDAAARRRRVLALLFALPAAALLLALQKGASGAQLASLLPAVLAAVAASALLGRDGGRIALLPGRVLLLAPGGRYQLQARSALCARGGWLLLGDIAVAGHLPGLPGTPHALLASAGLDRAPPCRRARLLGALWNQRHPWLLAALLLAAGWLASALLWLA